MKTLYDKSQNLITENSIEYSTGKSSYFWFSQEELDMLDQARDKKGYRNKDLKTDIKSENYDRRDCIN